MRSPGTIWHIAMSHTPLWEGPSAPVTPARSSTKVTGARCRATSMRTWSKARLRKVAYRATTGWAPSYAIPAAQAAASCSAIPTSMTRPGNASCSGPRPTGRIMAAVTPTTSSRSRAMRTISSANTLVHPNRAGATGSPVSGWIGPTAWKRSAMSSSAGT